MLQESIKQEKWDKGRKFLLRNKYEFFSWNHGIRKQRNRKRNMQQGKRSGCWLKGWRDRRIHNKKEN
jgi:hypothetical protein